MKEKLIALLSLKADATDDQVLAAVTELQKKSLEETSVRKAEKEITDLIQQSGGALNRTQAVQVIADRKTHIAAQEKKAKK